MSEFTKTQAPEPAKKSLREIKKVEKNQNGLNQTAENGDSQPQ